MVDQSTILKSTATEPSRAFTFDHSYWSFDGYHEEEDGYFSPLEGSNYCDQRRIFNDLGQDILNNAFDGFNSAIFAYGQTGSGSKTNSNEYVLCIYIWKVLQTHTAINAYN